MYFNNLHILIYVLIGFIGVVVGKFIAWCSIRLPENKKIISKEFFKVNKEGIKNSYIYIALIAIIYIFTLYRFGIKNDDFFKNLELIKFLLLIPMLVLTFVIDIKHRIIPNRLNLTIFEVGVIITFLYGITNLNMVKEYIFGGLLGLVIFGVITFIGGIFAGREAMGLGDVKFMGAVGLYFGINSVIEISILSFLLAAICSIIILIIRFVILKKKDDYIAFGPFLALSSFACIYLPTGIVLETFLNFCKMLSSLL